MWMAMQHLYDDTLLRLPVILNPDQRNLVKGQSSTDGLKKLEQETGKRPDICHYLDLNCLLSIIISWIFSIQLYTVATYYSIITSNYYSFIHGKHCTNVTWQFVAQPPLGVRLTSPPDTVAHSVTSVFVCVLYYMCILLQINFKAVVLISELCYTNIYDA